MVRARILRIVEIDFSSEVECVSDQGGGYTRHVVHDKCILLRREYWCWTLQKMLKKSAVVSIFLADMMFLCVCVLFIDCYFGNVSVCICVCESVYVHMCSVWLAENRTKKKDD